MTELNALPKTHTSTHDIIPPNVDTVITIPGVVPSHATPSTPAHPLPHHPRSIILFDGVCNVCNGFVQFVHPRDKQKRFWFQAQQTVKGRELLMLYNCPMDLNTVILIDEAEGKVYLKSAAIFKITEHLESPWPTLSYLMWIPGPVRDLGYNVFASLRYYIAGKKDTCGVLPGIRDRFVDFRSPVIELDDNKNL
eukprot:TRINITY_DN2549_c0_g1_i1.p2 TRINITY_DN2549_c0_g1~~TRINITY_DN2549_c0_g1_i1.p2  ORF type:complete len:194 (-),score=47.08 TRINITY_DN2549_c0_g1_i1:35-616(-)